MLRRAAFFVTFLNFVTLIFGANTKDSTQCLSGMSIKTLGNSGKVLMQGGCVSDVAEASACTLEIDELKEVDMNGTEVGKSAKEKHIFNTFANQPFAFSDLTKKSYQDIAADYFEFNANLSSVSATVKVMVYVFSGDGSFSNNDEKTYVAKSNVKISFAIENWDFCGCSKGQDEETGEYLDMTITIKTKAQPAKKTDADKKNQDEGTDNYATGDGELKLSRQVQIIEDGQTVWKTMPDGYPKVALNGNKSKFIFRLPKSDSIMYDPVLDLPSGAIRLTWMPMISGLAAILLLIAVTY